MGGRDTLQAKLKAAFARSFVGREAELEEVELLCRGEGPQLLHFHAPGGFGKTTLLRELARRQPDETAVAFLDAGAVDPDVAALQQAFDRAVESVRASEPGSLLLLDSFDQHRALEHEYASSLLASLPSTTYVVSAGRLPLSPAFTVDPGWSSLVRQRALQPLDLADARALLERRGVSPEQSERLARRAAGHPLSLACLSLAEHLRHPRELGSLRLPELSTGLLRERADVLGALAAMPTLKRAFLSEVVGPDELGSSETWLATLPFVRAVEDGFEVHALYREPIQCGLSLVAPDRFERTQQLAAEWFSTEQPATQDDANAPSDRPSKPGPSSPPIEDLRQALRYVHDDARLADTRLAAHTAPCASTAERAATTRELLKCALERLPDGPEQPSARALVELTFFKQLTKQLEVADRVGLAYTTYRRKLRHALENMAVQLDFLAQQQPLDEPCATRVAQ